MKLFDVVRLDSDLSEEGLLRGAEGTIIEVYEKPEPAYEVEFTDGTTAAVLPELLSPRWSARPRRGRSRPSRRRF
ncbi:DUF4926 domain-containing protein [Micromonospora rifamycinica]|uniref:DUF4926 domain-containing protein n=1 Tax=Micromonospora rifamycinica TaxID=291594 RepID=A0A1C5J9H9_9ACTN|nr:DUF4926 domain-containing protein [Micromonospora rifamycinica]SCG67274.1 protein of unknown function [Micromonospora rifamycinica]